MQPGDYTTPPYYQHYPPQSYQHPPLSPPPPPSQQQPSYASAPPYAAPDYSSFSQNYPPFPHTVPDPTPPPTAPPPLYNPPPPPPQPQPTPPDSHFLHNSQFQNYPPYDPNYTSSNYPPLTTGSSYPNPNSSTYEKSYDNSPKYEHGQGYFGEKLGGYGSLGSSRSNLGGGYDYPDPNLNPNPALNGQSSYDNAPKYGSGQGYFEENLGGYGGFGSSRSSLGAKFDLKEYKDDGVYAYEGKNEPYGARGTATSKSSNWSGLFDDYGRAISFPKEEKKSGSSGALKVVRAVPKAEDKTDSKSGVQKFRVKLLAESGGQSVTDVLCMVGLDGIRMLDPNTSRTLRIYPLETVTRCDKLDSSTFAFWSKASVDIEPRRIRLQSNSYTTNTILDTVTAATVQFKEMGGRPRPSELPRAVEQTAEKKKGLTDWISKLKPVNEEKDHWVPDEAASKCTGCGSDFSAFNRRHHCRNCGDVFCDKCTQGRTPLTAEENAQPVRVCDRCMAEVTHRLSKAKEAVSRPITLQSHEDLAKKLQEEMEKNFKISSACIGVPRTQGSGGAPHLLKARRHSKGSKSESSGRRMREVACPTCTVHLQVQVPSSGSETIECGVCQHPFLVSAH